MEDEQRCQEAATAAGMLSQELPDGVPCCWHWAPDGLLPPPGHHQSRFFLPPTKPGSQGFLRLQKVKLAFGASVTE